MYLEDDCSLYQEFVVIRVINAFLIFRFPAALFFLTYEEMKTVIQPRISADYYTPFHMGAAAMAEMVLL